MSEWVKSARSSDFHVYRIFRPDIVVADYAPTDQRGQLLPRLEHARLYRGLGDADYLGNSLTDLDRPRTSVPGRTSRHRKESAGR
jgi:hypothetical protein